MVDRNGRPDDPLFYKTIYKQKAWFYSAEIFVTSFLSHNIKLLIFKYLYWWLFWDFNPFSRFFLITNQISMFISLHFHWQIDQTFWRKDRGFSKNAIRNKSSVKMTTELAIKERTQLYKYKGKDVDVRATTSSLCWHLFSEV